MTIKLIVGLNNPGKEYESTRHNAGRWVVDEFCRRNNVSLKEDKKFFGLVGEATINNNRVRILLPTTFMNLSGKAIQALANFYNIKPEEILVIHDELDLPIGVSKFKFAGGHGGHNGLRDTHRVFGDKYWRLRFGIDHPGSKDKVTGHVLGKPPASEMEKHRENIDKSARGLEDIFYSDLNQVMNKFNSN